MGYCVLEHRADGTLRFVTPGVCASRAEARSALERALSEGDASVTGEVLIVDLEAATPVIVLTRVVSAEAPQMAREEPIEVLADEPAGMPAEPEAAEHTEAGEEEPPEPQPEVAAEAETEAQPEVVAEAEREVSAEAQPEATAEATPEAANEVEPEVAFEPPLEVVAELASGHMEVVGPSGTAWSVGVLGREDEAEAELAEALRRAALSLEEEGIVAPESVGSEEVAAPRAVVLTAHAVEMSELATESEVIGFSASGELQLGDYTCRDCVYANTCPRMGQLTPSECGAFQWRAD